MCIIVINFHFLGKVLNMPYKAAELGKMITEPQFIKLGECTWFYPVFAGVRRVFWRIPRIRALQEKGLAGMRERDRASSLVVGRLEMGSNLLSCSPSGPDRVLTLCTSWRTVMQLATFVNGTHHCLEITLFTFPNFSPDDLASSFFE